MAYNHANTARATFEVERCGDDYVVVDASTGHPVTSPECAMMARSFCDEINFVAKTQGSYGVTNVLCAAA